MKFASPVISLIWFLSLSQVCAQDTLNRHERYIEVTAAGEVSYEPDSIIYMLTVKPSAIDYMDQIYMEKNKRKSGRLSARFKAEVDEKYNRVWKILNSIGIKDKVRFDEGEYIISADSEDELNTVSYERIFYVHLENNNAVKRLIDSLRPYKLCEGSVFLSLKREAGELEVMAGQKAIKNARIKAEQLLDGTASRVGKILLVKEAEASDILARIAGSGWSIPLPNAYGSVWMASGNTGDSDKIIRTITVRFELY